MNPKDVGNLMVSPRARAVLGETSVESYLERHFAGDYGDLPMGQLFANDLALYYKVGFARSIYNLDDTERLVITTTYNQVVTAVTVESDLEEP